MPEPDSLPLAIAGVSHHTANVAAIEAFRFAGEPEFEPVEGTGVARAVNTGFDILEFEGRYYLLYGGAWYVADAPIGPWSITSPV